VSRRCPFTAACSQRVGRAFAQVAVAAERPAAPARAPGQPVAGRSGAPGRPAAGRSPAKPQLDCSLHEHEAEQRAASRLAEQGDL